MTKWQLIKIIRSLRDSAEDKEALEAKELFPDYDPDGKSYKVGDKVLYSNKLYRCIQAHTSQDSWTPEAAPSLWAEVLIPDPEVIPDWVQPESTNPYMKGDKVRHVNKIWISDVDGNVWEPGVYGWTEVTE